MQMKKSINSFMHTYSIAHFDMDFNRRQVLKNLRDISLLGIGSVLGIHFFRDFKQILSPLQSQVLDTAQSFFDSNVPQAILSLPLESFFVPHEYASILETRLTREQGNKQGFIIPLAFDNHTNRYLPAPIKHINSPFLSYHYDTLESLCKDLEAEGFYMRMLNGDFVYTIQKELFVFLQDNIKYFKSKEALYNEYKKIEQASNNKSDEDIPLAIEAYHKAMDYLDNLAQGDFNTYLQNDKINSSKHRDFLKDLEIIGNNNLKALYLGINEKQERKDKGMIEADFKESKKKESRNDSNSNNNKTKDNKTSTKQSRPKLIGRLASMIVDTRRVDSRGGEEAKIKQNL